MSPEERQLLQGLFDRIRSGAANQRDREAEAFIADNIRQQPYAPYLLAQTVIVQDQALRAANERLQQLESQNEELQRQAPAQQPGSGGFLSGLGSLFGSGSQPQQPGYGGSVPPSGAQPQARPWGAQPQNPQAYPGPGFSQPPAYAPLQGGGPWASAPQQGYPQQAAPPASGGGSSFLHGALGAAAGVAGGVLLADSIRGLFGSHNNGLGIASGFGGGGFGGGGLGGGGETVVNNYYGSDPGAGGMPQDAGYQDAGFQDGGFDQGLGGGMDDFSGGNDYTDT